MISRWISKPPNYKVGARSSSKSKLKQAWNFSSIIKLKPSFSIIKYNKTLDMAGVGDSRSINPNLSQSLFFHPIGYLKMIKKHEIVPVLQFEPIRTT